MATQNGTKVNKIRTIQISWIHFATNCKLESYLKTKPLNNTWPTQILYLTFIEISKDRNNINGIVAWPAYGGIVVFMVS